MRWTILMKKISTRLLIGVIVVAVLISAVGYLSIHKLEQASLQSIEANLNGYSLLSANAMNRTIIDRHAELETYSEDASLVDFAIRSNDEFAKMEHRKEFIDRIDKDWIAGKDTPFINSIMHDELSNELQKHIDRFAGNYGHNLVEELFVSNKYGAVIGSTNRTTDYRQDDESWFQKTVSEGKSWIGGIIYDPSTKSTALNIYIPLKNQEGGVEGVMKGVLELKDLKDSIEIIQQCSPYNHTQAYLIDTQGNVLLSTSSVSVEKNKSPNSTSDANDKLENIIQKVVTESKSSQNGYLLSNKAQSDNLWFYSRFPITSEMRHLEWLLVIEYKKGEVLKDVIAAKHFLILASLGIVLFALFIGMLFARSITSRSTA